MKFAFDYSIINVLCSLHHTKYNRKPSCTLPILGFFCQPLATPLYYNTNYAEICRNYDTIRKGGDHMIEDIVEPLLVWYRINKRDLPWRRSMDPYLIWVSEIMLQQTRVEAVIPYFERFTKHLPTIKALATIEEDKLMKLWEGLGYYSRVRNMQKCAKILVENKMETLPCSYEELIKLPGIGPYTAGAVASIAGGERVCAVDGNVLRVISRIIASEENVSDPNTKKEIENLLGKALPVKSGDFNQSLMELGRVICIPGNPRCSICPIQKNCLGYEKGIMWRLPIKDKKKDKTEESRTVLLLIYKNQVAIRKRPNTGLLASLWEFPNFDTISVEEIHRMYSVQYIKETSPYTHIFTHKIWHMNGYVVILQELSLEALTWVSLEEVKEKYSIPTAFGYFLEDIKNML